MMHMDIGGTRTQFPCLNHQSNSINAKAGEATETESNSECVSE